jgi:hypothetical protein
MKKPMKKFKRFNGEDGSTVEFDNRTVKGAKPSDYEINPESGKPYLPVDKAAPADTSLISEPKAKKAAPKATPKPADKPAAAKTVDKVEPKNEVIPESDYAKKMNAGKGQAPLSRFTSNLGSPYPVDKPKEATAVKPASSKSYAEKMEAGRNQTSLGKSIRSFFSGKPYGAEKFEKEERMKKDLGDGMKAGGKVSSASKRADGCAVRGKTRA